MLPHIVFGTRDTRLGVDTDATQLPFKMLFLKEQLYPSFVVEVLASSQSRLSQHVSRTVLPSAPPNTGISKMPMCHQAP